MAPGTRSKIGDPCSNLSSFASKFRVVQKVLVTLLGFSAPSTVIRHPIVTWRPGNCIPLAPLRYVPAFNSWDSGDLYLSLLLR